MHRNASLTIYLSSHGRVFNRADSGEIVAENEFVRACRFKSGNPVTGSRASGSATNQPLSTLAGVFLVKVVRMACWR
jgi:hypothetical protein